MNERPDREAAKRRIMFVPGEDFYFLAYTLLVLLDEVGATSSKRPLRDSRKLSYVADFAGGDSDLRLAVTSAPLSFSARSRLALLYDRAVTRRAAVERLIEALTIRGLVAVDRDLGGPDRVHVLATEQVGALVDNLLFEAERRRIQLLRRTMPQLRTMTLATLKQRLFGDRGVRTWGD